DSTGSEAGEEEGTDAEAGNDDTTTGGDTTTGATNPGTSSTTRTETDTDTTGPVINGCEGPWPAGGTAPMIDDLEVAADAEAPDNAVIPHDNRVGYWYVYASTAAGAPTEIVLDPPNGTEMVLPSDADAYAGTYSMIVTGSDVVNAVDDAGAT